MRDPDRIIEFCDRLKAAWSKVPDQRFGQLFCNALRFTTRDPFYIEDGEMLEIFERCVKREE